MVTYKTRHRDENGAPVTLSFGLGKAIKINAIIGLPTIKKWKMILDLDSNKATSKYLNIYFDLCYEHAAQGMSKGIPFDSTQFIHPQRANAIGLTLLTQYAAAIFTPVYSAPVLSIKHGLTSDWLSQDGNGRILVIEVPEKVWRPKVVSRYTTPEFHGDDVDGSLD